MDLNTVLSSLSFDNSRFDEINNNNIEHMDITSLFKLENNQLQGDSLLNIEQT